jgi:CPA2 family monovalent cation:H+ antiporter-2
MHQAPLITTVVAGLVLAFIFGAIANRLKMPPLVGYLIAGVAVGPHTPGFVADTELAFELSEIGVVLLMFGVGLNFSLKDLISVQAVAIPGALLRIAAGTAMGVGMGMLMGWSLGGGLLFGLALSVASTVVALKALHDRHLLDSDRGRIAIGWVIVEDIVTVLALVLIPAFAGVLGGTATAIDDPFVNLVERGLGTQLDTLGVVAVTVVKLAAFVGFMLVVGRRLIPLILHYTAHTGSRELFRLAVLAIALGVAAGSAYLFGVSLALGAFFAGMILSESQLSQRAAQESLPFRDAFAVLFFVAVGMLFDPTILIREPLPVLGTLFIIVIGKSVVGFLTVLLVRRPVGTALTVSAALAQIGEFSFILATLGLSVGLLDREAQDLIVAGAILSIVLNPLLFWAAERVRPVLETRFKGAGPEAVRTEPDLAVSAHAVAAEPVTEEIEHPTALTAHTVLAGFGRVGSVVGRGLLDANKPFLVIEDAEGRIAAARALGIEVIEGNAASSHVLNLANIEGATTLVIAIPNAFEAGQATEQGRHHNPGLFIIARAHSDEEEKYLLNLGANTAILGEREIGVAMLELVDHGKQDATTAAVLDALESAIKADPKPAAPAAPQRPVQTGIDEEALARAIGVPLTPPPAPDAAHAPEPEPEFVDVVDDATAASGEPDATPASEPPPEPAPAPVPAAPSPPAPTPAPAPEPSAEVIPFKARRPARTAATPFNPEVPPAGEPEKSS